MLFTIKTALKMFVLNNSNLLKAAPSQREMFGLQESLVALVEKKTNQFSRILKKSLKVKNESLLIISDYGHAGNEVAPLLGLGYYLAGKAKKLHVDFLFQDTKKGFMQADDHVKLALQKLEPGNIVIITVSNKLGRMGQEKSFRSFCKEQGHRFLSTTGLQGLKTSHFDILLETMSINYARLKKKGMQIKKKWDEASEIRVTTPAGTDITFNVSGMQAIANIGQYHEPGSGGNMPAGEVYIPPKGFYGVWGKVVLDGSMKLDTGALLLDSPVTLHVENGRISKVEGKHAAKLLKTLENFENRAKYPYRIRHIGELGVGINPGAVLLGSTILDEKVLGTAHVAIGSNYWFGGDIKTIFHGDQVFKNPVFYVDGKKMEI
jgi:hypothetical protein